MSGKILVVDGLATNRIVLKVKLATAYYEVIQAANGAEALSLAQRERPDLILLSARLPDQCGSDFLTALKGRLGRETPPALMFLTEDNSQTRLDALKAGAADILVKPVDEQVLLARLRSLLRQHQAARDMRMHLESASEFGFSEALGRFEIPGRIGLISGGNTATVRLQTELRTMSRHRVMSLDPEGALTSPGPEEGPDVYLLWISASNADEMRGLITKLRAAPHSRHRPVMVVLAPDASEQMASALDLGADDAMQDMQDTRELALRIDRQINEMRCAESMRKHLRHSLKAAMVDPLTGLYNRRYALPYLDRLIDAAHCENRSYAVMVADLDYFKLVNDRYGHATGDAVLNHVARILKSCLRSDDMIARIGGEEFLIVVPNSSPAAARELASHLCDTVRKCPVHTATGAPPVTVTVSIGVMLGHPLPDGAKPDAHTLLDEADRALYRSKSIGRDTVTFGPRTAA